MMRIFRCYIDIYNIFYIDISTEYQDVLSFRQSMVRRVEEILQLKELQEKIKETETQLKLAKHDN